MRVIFDLTEFNNFLKTTDDVTVLLDLVTGLSGAIFKSEDNFETILTSQTPYAFSQAILQLAKRHHLDSSDKSDVDLFLRHLKEAIVALPTVHVTLAFLPKQALIEELSEWFITNYQTKVLLHIVVDPTIIGGAVFSFNGKYRDFSLRKKLRELQERSGVRQKMEDERLIS
jgi:F0F1-type ATP synthase delta subunit